MPRTMREATEAYQKEFEHRIGGLVGVLEPASTVVVGAIVGFIAFSMFLPIYTGLDAIR
ncbi:MAG TPA: hypothetical protein VFA32_11320 [Dehalococcoidia bacterium]|nr:hypothetical protein [Dehalococcoidia bacterium]